MTKNCRSEAHKGRCERVDCHPHFKEQKKFLPLQCAPRYSQLLIYKRYDHTKLFFAFFIVLTLLLVTSCSRGPASGENPAEKVARSGEFLYKKYCASCHQGRLPRSPVLGKKEDWVDRVEKGRAALIENVRVGVPPLMPKMGSCKNCTDEELGNAVDYMLAALEDDEEESE